MWLSPSTSTLYFIRTKYLLALVCAKFVSLMKKILEVMCTAFLPKIYHIYAQILCLHICNFLCCILGLFVFCTKNIFQFWNSEYFSYSDVIAEIAIKNKMSFIHSSLCRTDTTLYDESRSADRSPIVHNWNQLVLKPWGVRKWLIPRDLKCSARGVKTERCVRLKEMVRMCLNEPNPAISAAIEGFHMLHEQRGWANRSKKGAISVVFKS